MTEQKTPRKGDRVKFNPKGTATVIEGELTYSRGSYKQGASGATIFEVAGVDRGWTTSDAAKDFETDLVENLQITKRLYLVGDVVSPEEMGQLPQGTVVLANDGVAWQLAGDTNTWTSSLGGVRQPDDFKIKPKVVFLP